MQGDDLPNKDDAQRAQCRATRCLPGEIAEYVLLPGDPGRAAMIARDWLDDGELVMANREFHSYTGTYKGIRMSVISTGLGSPGAVMVVQDLPALGVKAAIRVGTAGSAVASVKPGDLVIASGAVRDEGVSHKFIAAEYPAVPDADLTESLRKVARDTMAQSQGGTTHTGILHTSDAFNCPGLAEQQRLYAQAGVLAFEMEAAAVLTIAALISLPAACIVSIDGYVSNIAQGNTVPDSDARDRGIQHAVMIALEGLLDQSKQDKG
jgi:DeoD family purine-nucleoside phosphorylase